MEFSSLKLRVGHVAFEVASGVHDFARHVLRLDTISVGPFHQSLDLVG